MESQAGDVQRDIDDHDAGADLCPEAAAVGDRVVPHLPYDATAGDGRSDACGQPASSAIGRR